MKKSSSALETQVIRNLKVHAPRQDDSMRFKVQKSQARFKRIRKPKGPDVGIGEFFLLIDITALKENLYIPLSIASGKKTTGFMYQIEGTAEGTIATTDISTRGEGVTQVTLGTLLYAKIPGGKTASFRILIKMRGKIGKEYKIVITRLNYKRSLSDARYIRFNTVINSKTVRFR